MEGDNSKQVEQYRKHLSLPYWEIHEAAFLLTGHLDFSLSFEIEPEDQEKVQRVEFHYWPIALTNDRDFQREPEEVAIILNTLCAGIEKYRVNAEEIRIRYHDFSLAKEHPSGQKDRTLFLKPYELLFTALSEGIKLPPALQIASGLLHSDDHSPLSEAKSEPIKRLSIAAIVAFNKPELSIAAVCRQLDDLKAINWEYAIWEDGKQKMEKRKPFDFLRSPGAEKRSREDVIEVKKELPKIPGIESESKFHFPKFAVAVKTIAECALHLKFTEDEIFSYPLIKTYTENTSPAIEQFMRFALRSHLDFLRKTNHSSDSLIRIPIV